MRLFIVFSVFLFIPFIAAPVMAQENASGAVADKTSTRIVTDSENGQIRFYIKDKLAAVLNDDGLHVRESTLYGGALTGYGRKGFDDLADDRAPEKDEADAD